MRRTLKLLSLVGVATAAGVAAARRLTSVGPAGELGALEGVPNVSQELRQALNRFEERFGA